MLKQKVKLSLIFIVFTFLAIFVSTNLFKQLLYKTADFFYNDSDGVQILKIFSNTPYQNLVKPNHTRGKYITSLYQIISDINNTLNELHIEYWIDGGTLLGAVRHKGIIPWDDDLDIQILEDRHERLERCGFPILSKLGYKIAQHDGYYKINAGQELIDLQDNELPPSCDIFLAKETEGRLIMKGWKASIKLKDLKPLKLYKFGPLEVWGINNPEPYLIELYGKNWALLANRGSDHITFNQDNSSGVPFFLKDNDFEPAMPDITLNDNIFRIKEFITELPSSCK